MENKYKYLNNKEAEALDLLVQNLKAYLQDQLLQIKLFGSKSRGNFDSDSDIDILLILKKKTEEAFEKIAEIHLDVELKYDSHISLIIFSEYEYNQNKALETPFTKNVMQEGIVL